jgi:hypothetical protein
LATPYRHVHEIHARCGDLDQRLSRARDRIRAINHFQHYCSTCSVHHDRLHSYTSIIE